MKRDYTVWRNREQHEGIDANYMLNVLSNGKVEAFYWDLWTSNIRAAAEHKLPFISDLFDTKSGPCLMCGAGPSLADNIVEVMRLQAQGVDIIATDRSLKTLKDHGISPVLTVSTECQPECGDFLECMEPGEIAALGMISCESTRQMLLDKGCKVYNILYMVPGSNMNKWTEELLGGDFTCVRSGGIVGYISTDIAFWMGYDPIYTIGNELCYKDAESCANDAAILKDGGSAYIRRLADGAWTFPMFEKVAEDFGNFPASHADHTFIDLSDKGKAHWQKASINDIEGPGAKSPGSLSSLTGERKVS